MTDLEAISQRTGRSGTQAASNTARRLRLVPLGMSLGLFLAITYVICVLFDLWLPAYAMHEAWLVYLPGVSWLSWPSFFLGLIETFAYGWYAALVFVPLYNFFKARTQ